MLYQFGCLAAKRWHGCSTNNSTNTKIIKINTTKKTRTARPNKTRGLEPFPLNGEAFCVLYMTFVSRVITFQRQRVKVEKHNRNVIAIFIDSCTCRFLVYISATSYRSWNLVINTKPCQI